MRVQFVQNISYDLQYSCIYGWICIFIKLPSVSTLTRVSSSISKDALTCSAHNTICTAAKCFRLELQRFACILFARIIDMNRNKTFIVKYNSASTIKKPLRVIHAVSAMMGHFQRRFSINVPVRTARGRCSEVTIRYY